MVGVWHNDFWRHNQFLGEVTIPLDKVDWSNPSDKWYGLQESVSVTVVLNILRITSSNLSVTGSILIFYQ